ncbi:hypothetical protein [Lewinella cohaerens]|uniref:hypothetical protein n=1 Tax=Lewinella cohaerens TaxID=70995 RepID=UPI00036DF8FA|nr:hypothetical protein [Lewinella cohaerens]
MKKTLYLFIIPLLVACDTSGNSSQGFVSDVGNTIVDDIAAGDVSVGFQPVFLPIKFSLSSKGVKVSLSKSWVTFIGTFSLSYSRDLYKGRTQMEYAKPVPIKESSMYEYYEFVDIDVRDRPEVKSLLVSKRDLVVAVIRSEDQVDIFVIEEGVSLMVLTEGITRSTITSDYHEIDARHAKVRELVLTVDEDAQRKADILPDTYAADRHTINRDILRDDSDIVDKEIKSMSEIAPRPKDYSLSVEAADTLKQKKHSPY